ncbi:NAD-dependent epimerase/dehydratase family protein [Prosthecodimorpha staleyi]|uniref:NAD-dependent epimerase/dehydratase family protein n=1 Tax=Prosthecodimorpha staleyi TaxID=2840188 RepID=A0A947D8H1_9HYPH|nr:NAD-dependent epimerase/dehydratase family protein [Prosthecodimorpha staleyi]MBT9289972.1 NAD-dependent epimerase/dehydratase family protein [Prosthecodimorpha staleyi]
MRVFITGTAGFIGFHLARRLLGEGHVVTGYDGMTAYYDLRLKRARSAILARAPGFIGVTGMLEDREALERAVEASDPEVVIHLAAQAGVRHSIDNPGAYIASNLVGSWNLLDICRQARPGHLLLASTSSVYGANAKVPFSETDRADEPMSLYAATKKSMEAMAHSQAHIHGVPTTAFRFFTVYGPWGRPDMAMFRFTDAILKGEPIDLYGEGRMQRDFTYIDDLIEAIVRLIPLAPALPADLSAAAEAGLSPIAPFRVVNIGSGRPIGLMDFVAAIEAAIGRKAETRLLPMQPGDVPRTYCAPDLLERLTGYLPSTPVAEGAHHFVDWFRTEYSAAVEGA